MTLLRSSVAWLCGLTACGSGGHVNDTAAPMDDTAPPLETSASGADGDAEPAALIDHQAWLQAEIADDPLSAHRPTQTVCPTASYVVENSALELQTGYCNYAALTQPLVADVAAGQPIRVVLWHADLVFEAPAAGHVAIVIDNDVWWQTTVEIPAEPQIYDVTFDAPRAVEAGSPIMWHVHNHGFNTWTLLSVQTQAKSD